MISPTRPRRTASGLSRTSVRSAVSGMSRSLAKRLRLGVAGRALAPLLLRLLVRVPGLVLGDDEGSLPVDLRAQHPAPGVQPGEHQAEAEEPGRGEPGGDRRALRDPPDDPAARATHRGRTEQA